MVMGTVACEPGAGFISQINQSLQRTTSYLIMYAAPVQEMAGNCVFLDHTNFDGSVSL